MDPSQIPKPILDLAKETASRPASSFSEFISLKLFGKTNAKLRAEAENTYEQEKHRGEIERKAREPFITQLEAARAQREYTNLGNVLLKSAPLITTTTTKIEDDNDVFWGLLEHTKSISNKHIQELIAKIVAGEYNKPGTYAMSTLQTLKMLGKGELELIEKFGSLMIDNERIPEKLFELNEAEKIITKVLELDFASLQTLQSLGLILPNSMTRSIPNQNKNSILVQYFNKKLFYEPENESFDPIKLPPFYGPSNAGKQILQHLHPKYNEHYFQWLKKNYQIPNFRLSAS